MRPFSRPQQYRSQSPNGAEGNALVASGYKLREKDADTMRRISQPWQKRSFIYYDLVPEIKYAAQFYSKALSVLRLYVGEKQDDGSIKETENEQAKAQLERMQDPGGGGRETLLATYGRLRFLTGECYLFVSRDSDTDREQWEILSMDELRPEGRGYVRYRAPSLQPEQFIEPNDDDYEPVDDSHAVVYRLWQRHPRFSQLADSTMQGALEVCEELVLLTQGVRARARSRLAGSGILLVNGRYIPLPPNAEPGEDPNVDPFMRDLNDAMTAPIVNEGAASAVVPHVVRVDVDANQKLEDVMKHIQIIDPMQTYPETGLRMELIKRLSIGLDMPPEILVGLADSNHWNAWQVDEQTWKSHLQPVANAMVGDFTTAWFQPSLREEGMGDWEKYVIAYDATDVINHPDRGQDAKDAYAARAIGKKALRDALGFTDEDAPTEQELWEMLGIATRDPSLALYGIPSVRSGGIEPAPGEIVDSAGVQDAPPDGAPTQSNEVAKTPPVPENVLGALEQEVRVARILGAAEVAFYRARELAGSRLRNYARRDDEVWKTLDGVQAGQVAWKLGPDVAKALKAPAARELVAGGGELLAETLRSFGVELVAVEPLGERIEQLAARTLFTERPGPLPPAFTNYVIAVASSNGNGHRE